MAGNLDELPLPDELPVIPDGWSYEPLGDLVEDRGVSYGIVQPGSGAADGVPIVRVNNIRNGRIDTTDMLKVEAGIEKKFQRSRLHGGEVLLTLVGTLGEVAIVPDSLRGWNVARAVGVIPVRKDPGSLWVSICLRSAFIQHCIRTWATTTVQATFNLRDLAKLPIPIPPTDTREAIASVLGALDDKIELNRRMNATLEAMARALFQSWFVDFDPVRAKLDGRQPAGLDPTTAALFPDSFQESELGHIPKGWKVGVLDDLTSFVIGGDWGATEPSDAESVSCFCMRGADIPSLQEGGIGKMPTRFLKPSSVEKRQLMDGDLAIEISGGSPTQCTGRPVLVSDGLLRGLGRPLVASNFCRIVKLKSPALSKFVYCWLRSLYDAGSLFQFETGTTGIKNFAFVLFSEKYPLVVPDQRVAEAFDCIVSPFFARIQANANQSRTLATLRDTLLPKLLSGELSVVGVPAQAPARS